MAAKKVAKWRESASLIILSKFGQQQRPGCINTGYKVLLLQRPKKAKFMPDSFVFPGGVQDKEDESAQWLKHFNKLGVPQSKLNALTQGGHNVFHKPGADCLEKELSLRLTALREAFEEVGVLVGQQRSQLTRDKLRHGYGNVLQGLSIAERAAWQQRVHENPLQFQTLCEQLDIVPDLWSLQRWSTWLTPSNKPKRFATAFYLLALESEPPLLAERNEVAAYDWRTPLDYLLAYKRGELDLPPPQYYELLRLLNIREVDELLKHGQSSIYKTLLQPVQCTCTDGVVGLLPGDDLYPSEPNAYSERLPTGKSVADFRVGAKKLHRYEQLKDSTLKLELNYKLEGELTPVDFTKFDAKQSSK